MLIALGSKVSQFFNNDLKTNFLKQLFIMDLFNEYLRQGPNCVIDY